MRRNKKRVFAFALAMMVGLSSATVFANENDSKRQAKEKGEIKQEDNYKIEPLTSENKNLTYHVTVDGNDIDGDGSEAKPFQTIERARNEVRKNNKDMKSDIRVVIHGGTYAAENTLIFDEQDTATNGFKISYEAAPGEKPVITGGETITGTWEEVENGIYKTNVGDMRFRQLYVNGEKVRRATTKDITVDTGEASNFYRAAWNRDADRFKLQVKKSDFDLSKINKEALNQVEAVVIQHWSESYIRLDSIVENSRDDINLVQIQKEEHDILSNRGYSILRDGDPYYFENALEFVDQPGEWFLNNDTGDLYYMFKEGETVGDTVFTAPVTETLWKIQGTFDQPVENMEVHGLEFAYTTWLYPNEHGCINAQAGVYNTKTEKPNNQWIGRPSAGIYVACTENFVFERNQVRNMGATGLDLHYGTRNSKVQGNVLRDTSGNAIMIAVFNSEEQEFHEPYQPHDEREINKDDLIANNYITNVGTDYLGTTGIAAGYPQALTIEHNVIHNTPYTGITVGWGWHHNQKTPMEYNVIRNNEIYDVVKLMSDGAAIYTLSNQPNSQIVNNYIHDINHNAATQPAPVCAIFLDEGSSGFTVEKNVLENMNAGTRRIFRNANSNPISDNEFPLADVIMNAGIEPKYRDIIGEEASSEELPVINAVEGDLKPSTPVTIKGENFGTDTGTVSIIKDQLLYTAKNSAVVNWTQEEIQFVLPKGLKEGKAQIFIKTSKGTESEKCEVEIQKSAAGYHVTENFESYKADEKLPVNAVWGSQKDAVVIKEQENKFLQLSSTGANAKAVMVEKAENFSMMFDICFQSPMSILGEGLYMEFQNGMRLEWIHNPAKQKFNFFTNQRVASADYAPGVNEWYTIKLVNDHKKIKAKVWKKGEVEPSAWTIEADSDRAVKPLQLEYYHSTAGNLLIDNVIYDEILDESGDTDDKNLGTERFLDFTGAQPGALKEEDPWVKSVNAEIVNEAEDNVLKLNGKRANAIASLQGNYRNYDMTFDMRFDTELNKGDSEGLYLHFKDAGGSNFFRLEYLPGWNNVYTIKHGQSSVLAASNEVPVESQVWYTVKISCSGNKIQSKVWIKGETEPEKWTLQCEGQGITKGNISFQYYAVDGSLSLDNINIQNVDFTEVSDKRTIVKLEDLDGFNVWKGSNFYTLKLPQYIKAALDDETESDEIRVVWDSSSYKPDSADVQMISGILKTPYKIHNPQDIKAVISITPIDPFDLRQQVGRAESKVSQAYTPESFEVLTSLVAEVQNVLAGEPVSQEEINQYTERLNNAMNELVVISDIASYQALIQAASELADAQKDNLHTDAEEGYQGQYAQSMYDSFIQAIQESQQTYNKLTGSVEEDLLMQEEDIAFGALLEEGIQELTTAMETFKKSVVVVNKNNLNDAVKAAKELQLEGYTEDSKSILIQTIQEAEKIQQEYHVRQSDVDTILEQLNASMDGLQKVKLKVVFDSVQGSTVASIEAEYNMLLSKPDDPARNGYIFNGWFRDQKYTQAWDFTKDKVTENMTLYAKWSEHIIEKPVEKPAEKPKDETKPITDSKENHLQPAAVKTGDSMELFLFSGMMILAAGVLFIFKKR